MIREIHLHGGLGQQLGPLHRLSVGSIAEAVRALCTLLPGAREALEPGSYEISAEAPGGRRAVELPQIRFGLADDVRAIHIVPSVEGAARGGVVKAILGVALVGASFLIPGSGLAIAGGVKVSSGSVLSLGVGMALSGVGAMLAPTPKAPQRAADDERSTLFSDAINNPRPGAAIPVVFGECVVGSVVISAGLRTERRAT